MNIFKYLRKDKKTLLLMSIGTITFIFIYIPFLRFNMIGLLHKINAYPSLSPLCGLILGPIYGCFAILITLVIYYFLNPKAFYFGVFTVVPPILAVISAGALSEGNWKYSAVILAVGLIIFYLTDVGRIVYYHAFLSILALLLVILFKERVSLYLFNKDLKKVILGAIILSFVSVMIDHLYGSILGIIYLNLPAKDYIAVVPEFIKERVIMTALGAFFVIFAIEITKCFLKNATKLKEKVLDSHIEELVKIKSKNCLNVDENLLKKYNVKIPSEDEQKEVLKSIIETMVAKKEK